MNESIEHKHLGSSSIKLSPVKLSAIKYLRDQNSWYQNENINVINLPRSNQYDQKSAIIRDEAS